MRDAPPSPTLTDALTSNVPGIHWPAVAGTRAAAVLALLFQMESTQWLSGEALRERQNRQLGALLDGYEQLREFDRRELALIEPLRTLRLVHYSAWVARRWDDPAFPAAFPDFGTPDYWRGQVDTLVEQLEAMQAPPLVA